MAKPVKKIYPFVSVCTPTFNRRPFIETMFLCFKNQTYPKSRIEWIIVDDGTDKIRDLIAKSKIPQIKYIELEKKCFLGEKRNIMHSHCSPKSKYIVYMDDDDYYPPERIEHAVEILESNPTALCAGASEIYIFFKHIQKMYQCGPYGPNHATAGTFAFRTDLLKQTKYENGAALAEEKAFLKDYTIPFVQLDPLKTILVFSHIHNTFDKKKMLENPHPQYCKESPKTIEMFIKHKHEDNIKKFFTEGIEPLLKDYKPGEPIMKPDVLEQIKKIEKERDELNQKNGAGQIMMNRPGEEPIPLSQEQIIQLIQESQKEIQNQMAKSQKLQEENNIKDKQIELLNKKIFEKDEIIKKLKKEKENINENTQEREKTVYDFSNIVKESNAFENKIKEKSKSEPEFFVNVSD